MKTILLIDCDYLCHRAWYSTGHLDNGVIFGFFRELIELQDKFMPEAFCFCFDFGKNLRKVDYPKYKSNREPMPEEFEVQRHGLRRKHLKELGYNNIHYQRGYEADDVISGVSGNLPNNQRCIVVSSDSDLYQLLGPRTSIYRPSKGSIITEDSFSRDYGITPTQWVDCKAIAGCKTDCVEGIKGVGEKTAAKFLSGNLSPTSKAFEAIVKGTKTWKKNRHLVRLPYPGLGTFEVKKDSIKAGNWEELAERLGMFSISKRAPKRSKSKFLLEDG